MKPYVISAAARADIKNIVRYTLKEWGEKKMKAYVADLHALFEKLASNSNIGRKRSETKWADLKSFVYHSHIVFYEPHPRGILIVRVVHHAQDIVNHI